MAGESPSPPRAPSHGAHGAWARRGTGGRRTDHGMGSYWCEFRTNALPVIGWKRCGRSAPLPGPLLSPARFAARGGNTKPSRTPDPRPTKPPPPIPGLFRHAQRKPRMHHRPPRKRGKIETLPARPEEPRLGWTHPPDPHPTAGCAAPLFSSCCAETHPLRSPPPRDRPAHPTKGGMVVDLLVDIRSGGERPDDHRRGSRLGGASSRRSSHTAGHAKRGEPGPPGTGEWSGGGERSMGRLHKQEGDGGSLLLPMLSPAGLWGFPAGGMPPPHPAPEGTPPAGG